MFVVLRVITGCGVDTSLALLCGMLLAFRWLSPEQRQAIWPEATLFRRLLLLLSLVLFTALCLQLFVLTAEFTGASAPLAILHGLPDVLGTHAGRVLLYTNLAALLLLATGLMPAHTSTAAAPATIPLLACLLLRSATGHAATDGDLTSAELLQFVHLAAMSVWSGSVIVSGLHILPKLFRAANFAQPTHTGDGEDTTSHPLHYLRQLSTACTWALVLVLASGLYKSYRVVGVDLHQLRASAWGLVLATKIACVVLVITLGGLNRQVIHSPSPWHETSSSRLKKNLRVEAWLFLAILILSAILGNISPPGTDV